jgi:hypothetical protein
VSPARAELRIAITRDITRRKAIEHELAEKQAELGRSLRLAAAARWRALARAASTAVGDP